MRFARGTALDIARFSGMNPAVKSYLVSIAIGGIAAAVLFAMLAASTAEAVGSVAAAFLPFLG